MTKASMALFESQRKEVMSLGLTEAQYAEMIEAGKNWVCEALEVMDQGMVVCCTRHTMIDSVLGKLVLAMKNELMYMYRLIVCKYNSEEDDLQQFLADRKAILQLLLEDWKEDPSPVTMPIQNQ